MKISMRSKISGLCDVGERKKNCSKFPSLEEIVNENESSSSIPDVCEEIVAHLEVLSTPFDRYFDIGKVKTFEEWIMNPYAFNLGKVSGDEELKQDLIRTAFKWCS